MSRMNDRSTLEGGGVNGAARVLVIGGDHENTVASVRALSRHGITFDLILHGVRPGQKTMVAASRHAPEPLFAEGTYEAINDAVESWMGKSDPSRCILLPSSDLAALVIDERFRPRGARASGFVGDRWRISELMDKYAQAQWASMLGIPVAKGVEIDLTVDGGENLSGLGFPVIVKPAVSAEGQKSDITICRDAKEYVDAIQCYVNARYRRMLVQELIDYEYEITCVGLIRSDGTPVWRAYAKEIVYPKGRGSTVRVHLENESTVLKAIDGVLKTLAREGYRGLCDIEFFKTSERVMLNEVNFRQSGIVAFPFYEGLCLPLLWTQELLGCFEVAEVEYPVDSYCAISEGAYLHYLKGTGRSVSEWLQALKEPGGKVLLFSGDNGPFWAFIRSTLANQVRKVAGKIGLGAKH